MSRVFIAALISLVVFFLLDLFLITYPVVRARKILRSIAEGVKQEINRFDESGELDALLKVSRLVKGVTDELPQNEVRDKVCTLVKLLASLKDPQDILLPLPIPPECG
jgi:hypothetical protein